MKRCNKSAVFFASLALVLSASMAVYADTAEGAKEAYARILEQKSYITDFSLQDLNNDGIPEMKADIPYGFYTYYNGRVHEVYGVKGGLEVYPETGVVKYSRGFKDGTYYEQYSQLINGDLWLICDSDGDNYFSDGNGTAISQEAYVQLVNQYTSGQYAVIPFEEFYPNTPENRELYLTAGNNSPVVEVASTHDIGGVWKNDTCTLTIKDGHFKTVYTDENGQVHTVESGAQFAQDGDYFYAIPSDTGNIYYFDYERTGDQLHIWAESRHNGYVEGIIGRSDDERFRLATDYDDVNPEGYQEDSNLNPEWSADDSILPDSSSRRLTAEDIEGLTLQELSYARNEIAARHGRKFNSNELTEYFSSKSWYMPSLEPDDYNARVKSILNEYEIENADWLLSQEKNDAHPEGYILDQEGYDIAKARCQAERNGGTSDNSQDGSGTDLPPSPENIFGYGYYNENQGIISTGAARYSEILDMSFSFLDHDDMFTYEKSNGNGEWYFDFDQDGEDEMLVWAIDDHNAYHWKLFDMREGTVYQIAEDCGEKPGNASHNLKIMQDGSIHDYSAKAMAGYGAEWDNYIFCMDGDVHYLYGYTYFTHPNDNYKEDFVLTEAVYTLDGEIISSEEFDDIVENILTREVPRPVEGEPRTYHGPVNGEGITSTGFAYTTEEDHVILAKYEGDEITVNIPADIEGLPVTKIGSGCFCFNDTIKNVVIPDSVTEIGDEAFYWCKGLKAMDIPDSVTKIGYNAFEQCFDLENISLSNSLTEIENGTFEGCTAIKSCVIPDSVFRIGDSAFAYCTSIQKIDIPKSVEVIEGAAFADCYELKSVTIPSSVRSISMYVFYECNNLTDVYYEGTEEQWENFGIDVNGAVVHSSSGDSNTGVENENLLSYDYSDLSVSEQSEIEFLRALSEWIYLNHITEDRDDESNTEYSWNDLSIWNKYLNDWSFYSSDMDPEEKGMAIALYYFDKEDPRISYDESDYTYIVNMDYMQEIINGLFYDVNVEDIDCFVRTWVKKQFADQYKMYGNVLDGPQIPFYFDAIEDIQISDNLLSISGKIGFAEGVNTSSYEGCGYISTFIKKEVGGKDYWAFNAVQVIDRY